MAVKIAKREVTKLNCCGGVRESIKIAGRTFVCKKAPQWETVWSGSQSFTESGSFTVSGLSASDEAVFSATVDFIAYVYDEHAGDWQAYNYTDTVTDGSFPRTATNGYANVYFTRSGNVINFTFEPCQEEYKGYVSYTAPQTVTFTSVKKKV